MRETISARCCSSLSLLFLVARNSEPPSNRSQILKSGVVSAQIPRKFKDFQVSQYHYTKRPHVYFRVPFHTQDDFWCAVHVWHDITREAIPYFGSAEIANIYRTRRNGKEMRAIYNAIWKFLAGRGKLKLIRLYFGDDGFIMNSQQNVGG